MTGNVLGHVLPLAKREISGFHDDARSACTGVLAMHPGVFDADHDLMGNFTVDRRSSVRADITNNNRPIADAELRARVVANVQTFFKTERLTYPLHRLSDVSIDEDRHTGHLRDRTV